MEQYKYLTNQLYVAFYGTYKGNTDAGKYMIENLQLGLFEINSKNYAYEIVKKLDMPILRPNSGLLNKKANKKLINETCVCDIITLKEALNKYNIGNVDVALTDTDAKKLRNLILRASNLPYPDLEK